MSAKLDKSLDEILSTRRKTNRRTRGGAKSAKPTGTTTAPVGGIKKSTKPAKPAAKPNARPAPAAGPAPKESKIVVSNLPSDVNEAQIKEYFQQSVGAVRRVIITYNQHGVSRGIAQIYFGKQDAAAKAVKDLNGMLVDKKPMKIELVLDANSAPAPAQPKSLSERVAYAPESGRNRGQNGPLTKTSANPKAQPKSATTAKSKEATNANTRGGRAAGRGGRGARKGRVSRPKKTAAELDQEMTDYMSGANPSTDANGVAPAAAAAAPAPAAATGEDLGMDEIS